jgi:hypothetical protein
LGWKPCLGSKLPQHGSRTTPEHSSPDCEPSWSSLHGKCTTERSSSGFYKHAGANSSPGNPSPGGNPRLRHTRIGTIFKIILWKQLLKLKINIKQNPLNFKYIQWNHLQTFPISWDYLFKQAIRQFLNIVSAHIEGLKGIPPICLFETLLSCQCPF